MSNILINGISSKTGGGKNILDNFLRSLLEDDSKGNKYFVLTPNESEYAAYNTEHISIVSISDLYRINLLFPFLYYYKLPEIIGRLRIDLIFNFGDVVIPKVKEVKQIYFFDWAYAVYNESYIWKNMSAKEFLIRKLKVLLIGRYIKDVDLTYAQTLNIEQRLTRKYQIKQIKVVPTPISSVFFENNTEESDFCFPASKVKFFYPAGYAPHKNFDIIPKVCSLIKDENLPFIIVLTLDGNLPFTKSLIADYGNIVINVGKVPQDKIPALYKGIDILFFPSLLESYGIPYVEAMALHKGIITSDMDFAHAVCNDRALYFDPFNASSVVAKMKDVVNVNVSETTDYNNDNLSWNYVFGVFKQDINQLLKK